MKQTAIPELRFWSEFQPDRGIDFNGFWWRRRGGDRGDVLVDPMPLADGAIDGPVRWIVLTNADHVRAASELRERFGAQVLAPECDRQRLAGATTDAFYGPDTPLPDDLAGDVEVHWIRGGKTEAEAALWLRPFDAMVFGDVVRSHATGTLRLLPDEKLTDPALAARDVLALADREYRAVLLGDGDPLFTGADAAMRALFASLDA